MYGQKQILQCLAVALILAVLNFHRTAIKRNREIIKPRIIRKVGTGSSKIKQMDEENICVSNDGNFTGYCIRYPFGRNVCANHDSDFLCRHNCFDKFDTWLRKQCQANCCIRRSTAITLNTINFKTMTTTVAAAITAATKTNGSQRTRNVENALMKYVGENGASLHIKQCERAKTIIEPINEKLMGTKHINPVGEYECKIRSDNDDEFICKNTTSDTTVDFVKLETINKTKIAATTMEYHDFLFNLGLPETKTGSTQSFDRLSTMSSTFLAFISLLVAIFTIRIMWKLFMTDHTEAFLRVIEMRRTLHDRLEQIHADLNQERENEANNNITDNSISDSEHPEDEAFTQDNSINIADNKETDSGDAETKSTQQTSEQSM
ncbi:uncharacterized protein LOC129577082 [Sitodiplosis mosellana]|uniref:uncharacterized protein LOC129577082 n=1 Tax=Sitodiplosis mosellana TaxID=263140 RepID=UPI002444766D|nr:uncharacterized protein LOC129577082 [Sitodiplosis mosellana]